MRRVPVAASRIGMKDLLSGITAPLLRPALEDLARAVRAKINCRHVFFTDSGTSALYAALVALQTDDRRRQVVVPAYTSPSVVHAVGKAGLTPVFCDVSLDDFNMDPGLLDRAVSRDTLAVIGVHMFGIPSAGLGGVKDRFPRIYLVEDCAQAMGTRIGGAFCGNAGDLSLFSLNRGKNMPTYGGGVIATNSDGVAERMRWTLANLRPGKRLLGGLGCMAKIAALSVIVRPRVYGLVRPLLFALRERPAPADFPLLGYSRFQAGVALALLGKLEEQSEARYRHGTAIIAGLKDAEGLRLPRIAEGARPAFNRLPVLFEDPGRLAGAQGALSRAGIETSRMYGKALEELPNAGYAAERLLTLPVHPLLNEADIGTIVEEVSCSP